jgi:hypothetical protein
MLKTTLVGHRGGKATTNWLGVVLTALVFSTIYCLPLLPVSYLMGGAKNMVSHGPFFRAWLVSAFATLAIYLCRLVQSIRRSLKMPPESLPLL